MEKPTIPQQTLAKDEVSLKNWLLQLGELRAYVSSKWKMILGMVLIGAILGIGYALYRKTSYKAVCTFVLEDSEKSGGGLGQYSSLAAIVGLDVAGGSGLFQGDNIIELYKSRSMMERTLLSPSVFKGKRQLLVDRYIQMKKLNVAWAENDQLKNLSFSIPRQDFTMAHDSLISMMVDDLNKNYLSVSKPDKKLNIISVQVNASDPLFAKAFTETIVDNVNEFYVQTKTKGLRQNLGLLQKQADSVRRVLNASISGAAAALDVYPNANPIMQSLRVPSQRRQIDVQSASAIYGEVVKNLEIAKGALQRETPLIQVIDKPVLPLANNRIGKSKAALSGMGIGLILALVLLLSTRTYQQIMK